MGELQLPTLQTKQTRKPLHLKFHDVSEATPEALEANYVQPLQKL